MIICKHCNAEQLDGTLFCSACGAGLETYSRSTTASLARKLEQAVSQTSSSLHSSPAFTKPGKIITLVVAGSGRRIRVVSKDEHILGRKDNRTGATPGVDLSEEGGYDAGVSRQHAIISVQNGVCLVEDLESSNGTFINGRQLEPYKPTAIYHRDSLTLGKLLVRVEFSQD
jgi:pSer/pThr/pTyr-binding forkhead associated (FHA) protein